MSQPSATLEPAAVDSVAGDVEVAWQGPIEQAMAMGMMGPPLSPGMAELRKKFLEQTQAHVEFLERSARQVRQPWVRPYLEQARQQVAWVRDAGVDDPADYLAALREGRPWRSIGDAGLLAAAERCQALLAAAGRLLATWGGLVLSALLLAAWLLAITIRLLPQAQPPLVDPARFSQEADRAPPARRLAFVGLIDRALP
jgi:hypothetical protein